MKKAIFWILLIGNIFVSIIIPVFILPVASIKLTPYENIISSLLFAMVLFLIEIYVYINIIYDDKEKKDSIEKLNSDTDRKLYNTMRLVNIVNEKSFKSHDLFKFYIDKKIDELEKLANEAATSKKIQIKDNMIEITNEMYLSAFVGSSKSIFRPVYRCDDNDFFFEGFGKDYFKTAYTLVQTKKCKKIKRLFIYNCEKELNDERVKKLMYFHIYTSNYECKILKLSDYEDIKNDFEKNYVTGTFAVYGARYLYTEQTPPTVTQVIGHYSKDEKDINSFIKFFETCWDKAKDPIINSKKAIKIDDVFDKEWKL